MTIDLTATQELGENLRGQIVTENGQTYLVLVIKPAETHGDSSTGKMETIASSGGFVPLPGGLRGNVYIGKKKG